MHRRYMTSTFQQLRKLSYSQPKVDINKLPEVEAQLPRGCPVREVRLPQQKAYDQQPFPLILSPARGADRSGDEWIRWVGENRGLLKGLLIQYQAVIFRDFNQEHADHFDRFVKGFGYSAFPYIGGSSNRVSIVGDVFTASEAPSDTVITFHHEMDQQRLQPHHLFFYCEIAAKEQGETSLAPSHVIYERMREEQPEFVRRLESEGVTYSRVMPEHDDLTSAIGRGWRSTFKAETREEAEKNAKWQGNEVEWLADGCMKATSHRPGLRRHPKTGKMTWFNHILTHYLGWDDSRNVAKESVVFPSNRDPMPDDAMKTLEEVFESTAVDIPWREGDVMWVDNYQALHGRRPYQPPRRVLAALCKEEP